MKQRAASAKSGQDDEMAKKREQMREKFNKQK